MFNLRDIGGHEAEGGTVRQGLVMRSNALVELGDEGLRELSDLGIATAIDLREPGEREAEPNDLSELGAAVHELALIDGAADVLTLDLLSLNIWLLRERSDHLLGVIRLLNSPDALPGVYFCSSGKDRTGLVSALILSALGVEQEAVVADYTISESRFPVGYDERAVQRAIDGGMPESMLEEYRATGLGSPARVMEGTIDFLDGEYGGAAVYLVASGLRESELEELRAKLVEPG